mmetsp:Transcript_56900/g.166628  ORF Transcript_56900/g.166628 Transcript_56900/m.166628 type:complete len:307 (-) Transcript_56900:150-1070(-)
MRMRMRILKREPEMRRRSLRPTLDRAAARAVFRHVAREAHAVNLVATLPRKTRLGRPDGLARQLLAHLLKLLGACLHSQKVQVHRHSRIPAWVMRPRRRVLAEQGQSFVPEREDHAPVVREHLGQVDQPLKVGAATEAHPLCITLRILPHQDRTSGQVPLQLGDCPLQTDAAISVQVALPETSEWGQVADHWLHRLDERVHDVPAKAVHEREGAWLTVALLMRPAHRDALHVEREDVLERINGRLHALDSHPRCLPLRMLSALGLCLVLCLPGNPLAHKQRPLLEEACQAKEKSQRLPRERRSAMR